MDITSWIRGRRAEKREKQAETAELLGVSPSLLSEWERGLTKPVKVAQIRALAQWAGVEADEVFRLL